MLSLKVINLLMLKAFRGSIVQAVTFPSVTLGSCCCGSGHGDSFLQAQIRQQEMW